MTDLDRKSKHDTVYLADDAVSDPFVDLSEQRTNLTDNGTYFTEAASARAALTYPRCLVVKLQLDDDSAGTALYHGTITNTDYSFKMRINGGILECAENGALRVSVVIPELSGTLTTYLLAWSSRASGSSVRSEVMIYNYDTGTFAHGFATHATGTTNSAWQLNVNGYGAGVTAIATTFSGVYIGRRFMSQAEIREDWIAETSPPAVTAIRRRTGLPLDREDLPVIEGELASPYIWVGANTKASDRRLISPLVNLRCQGAMAMLNTFAPSAWWRTSPVAAHMHLSIHLLWRVPINSSRARVRIFVRQALAVGDDDNTTPVAYQMHSFKNLPTMLEPAPGELVTKLSTKVTCTTKHGSTGGEWLDLGALTLVVDTTGATWLALGVNFDDDSSSPLADDTVAAVLAVTVEPYNLPEVDNKDKKGP